MFEDRSKSRALALVVPSSRDNTYLLSEPPSERVDLIPCNQPSGFLSLSSVECFDPLAVNL
jgi:hypothetical protein